MELRDRPEYKTPLGSRHRTAPDARRFDTRRRHAADCASVIPRLAQRVLRRSVPRRARNWLRSPGQSLRWLMDEGRHAVGSHPALEIRPGWTLRCHPTAHRAITTSQLHDPAQAAELDEFIASCARDMVLFDLGAHFGVFSLAALRYGGPGAVAVAVEPSPAALRILRIQARLNDVADRLTPIRAAAGQRVGTQAMLAVGVIADGYYVAADADHPSSDLSPVSTISVDALTERLGVRPTHLKIDVEGQELAVLAGACETLAHRPAPTVFIELHHEIVRRRGGDPLEAVRLLETHGYTLREGGRPFVPHRAGHAPVTRLVART